MLGVDFIVIINAITVVFTVEMRAQGKEVDLGYLDVVFTSIYLLEMAIKLVALTPKLFFATSWNWYPSANTTFKTLP